MRIGVVCYGSFGGSGIVATELGLAMARRGHFVHFISRQAPRRYDRRLDQVWFHGVEMRDYPVLESPSYTVALASKIVEVCEWEGLDLVHVHYAVPHAASALLARSTLGARAPRFLTTLHGTDTTLVGADPAYRSVTRHAIEQSDGVSVPSEFLRRAAVQRLGLDPALPVEVLPNFVDTEAFAPAEGPNGRCLAQLFGGTDPALTLVHVSNFRQVKRTVDLIEVFARVAREVPARLLMIGDGPERSLCETRLREAGLADRARFLGMQEHFADLLSRTDVFVLPSESESFGLAALEAQSCGVPVVASDAGGLPEVVADGETGLLAPVGDIEALSAAVLRLARDEPLRRAMGAAARARVLERFREGPVVDRYEDWYRRVLG
ncbi:MAG: N-acetyl-alpha-D-glucosaminyl L-malate synthase BshA [Deltaproteobacteria bacterium]|nr:N-acetyl-alpha-D-glucosaminyl L-malate synthase BshA [Deltaproteobacteria bacterium]MCB9786696.1 N-acetyl-alpha-D-glucosaminyl L-malate synthase BshA [Deltaproteobacteria bacterium]